MRISIDGFNGVAPRITPKKLPEGFGQNAVNTRFLSGNLEPWLGSSAELGIEKAGTIVSVHGMDIDESVKWLQWTTAELGTGQTNVDVARGPIQGDSSERTYFTGTDVPRVTNLSLATTGASTGEYPYASYKLGIPAPTDVPVIEVVLDETGTAVGLINGDAETGDTTGWVIDSGQFIALTSAGALLPFEGTYFFGGGTTAATSQTTQSINLATEGIAIGSTLSLTWQQASGANLSTAGVTVRFKDSALSTIIDYVADEEAGAVDTWGARSIPDIIVPGEAVSMETIINFTKVGGGDLDAYIDDIILTNNNVAYSNDGSSVEGWVLSSSYTPVVNTSQGNPSPSIEMASFKSKTSYLYRNFSVDKVAKTNIKFEIQNITEAGLRLAVLFASSFGEGSGIEIDPHSGVYLCTSTSWTTAFTRGAKIYDNSAGSLLPDSPGAGSRVEISITNSGAVEVEFTTNAYRINTDTLLFTSTNTISLGGGYIGFQAYSSASNTTDRTWLDNINVTQTPVITSDQDLTAISYVYTYVNAFDEEGPPSEPSDTIIKDDSNTTIVTTGTSAPSGYGIEKKRIYRLATSTEGTDYFFVTELALATAVFNDDLLDSELDEILITVDWDLPPEDGHSILSLPNGITMIASKNDACPSVQFRPHAYPLDYRLTTDYPIVGMANIDTTVAVLTQAYPYVVVGSSPETLSMARFEQRQGCVSKRSIATIRNYGVLYASPDGLVAVSGAGGLQLVTDKYFSRREWQELIPSSIIAFVHDDKYFGFYNNEGGFIFDPINGSWTWVETIAQAGWSNPIDDSLYLVVSNALTKWEGSTSKLSYTWKSKMFDAPHPISFSCAQIDGEDWGTESLTFKWYVDRTLVYTKTVTSSTEFILPDKAGDEFEIQLEGTVNINNVQVAEDMDELQ